jgi:hypothetical protein
MKIAEVKLPDAVNQQIEETARLHLSVPELLRNLAETGRDSSHSFAAWHRVSDFASGSRRVGASVCAGVSFGWGSPGEEDRQAVGGERTILQKPMSTIIQNDGKTELPLEVQKALGVRPDY